MIFERETERERNIDVRETLIPYVPRPGIHLQPFGVWDDVPTN